MPFFHLFSLFTLVCKALSTLILILAKHTRPRSCIYYPHLATTVSLHTVSVLSSEAPPYPHVSRPCSDLTSPPTPLPLLHSPCLPPPLLLVWDDSVYSLTKHKIGYGKTPKAAPPFVQRDLPGGRDTGGPSVVDWTPRLKGRRAAVKVLPAGGRVKVTEREGRATENSTWGWVGWLSLALPLAAAASSRWGVNVCQPRCCYWNTKLYWSLLFFMQNNSGCILIYNDIHIFFQS